MLMGAQCPGERYYINPSEHPAARNLRATYDEKNGRQYKHLLSFGTRAICLIKPELLCIPRVVSRLLSMANSCTKFYSLNTDINVPLNMSSALINVMQIYIYATFEITCNSSFLKNHP